MRDPLPLSDPVGLLRFLTFFEYPPEETAEVLVDRFEIKPELALEIARAALREKQEADLADEAAWLDQMAAEAVARGLPLEVVIAEAEAEAEEETN